MKFPFVPRSRHEAAAARLKERITRAERKAANASEKLALMTAKRDRERRRADELEQLCNDRLRDIEELKSTIADLRRARSHLLDKVREAQPSAPFHGKAVPVILGVDVEPDARVVDLSDPSWRATVAFFSKAAELRERLSSTAGGARVRFTWFPMADPQVELANGSATWALEHFAKEWQAVAAAGDEIGLHMHPWRWDAVAGGWCQDHADEAWVVACVHASIVAYRKVFGVAPACYRGGDRYLSNAVVRALEEEGVGVDLTLERMPEVARLVEEERGTGSIPDGTNVPLRAYRPSSGDFRIPDPGKKSGLGMLPLTPYEHGSLSPWLPNKVFEEALDQLLNRVGDRDDSKSPTHLAFVVRANIADSPRWDDFVENALSLARRVREGRVAFATASETWKMVAGPGLSARIQ